MCSYVRMYYMYVFLMDSLEAAGASVTTVGLHATECSKARKLTGVCNEFQVSIYMYIGMF